MKSNSYLYGDDVFVPVIPADVVMRRIELLNEHLAELLEVHYLNRDTVRCNDIAKAIKFWERVNDEMVS